MIRTALGVIAVVEFALVALPMVRLARGPSVSDRIVALNTMSAQSALAVICYAGYAQRAIYLDVALWLASFSYLGAFVWARYLERGLL
jgi:multicomponent Na+:H+ antiporter subunit F